MLMTILEGHTRMQVPPLELEFWSRVVVWVRIARATWPEGHWADPDLFNQ